MKVSNKKVLIYIIAFIICGVIAFIIYNYITEENKKNKTDNFNNEEKVVNPIQETKTFEDKLLGVEIDGQMYIMELEEKNASKDLLFESPLKIIMEKDDKGLYGYLSSSLSTEGTYSSNAIKGDILLYNNNCIYILLDNIELDGSYVLLGHLENFDNFSINSDSVVVNFVR